MLIINLCFSFDVKIRGEILVIILCKTNYKWCITVHPHLMALGFICARNCKFTAVHGKSLTNFFFEIKRVLIFLKTGEKC